MDVVTFVPFQSFATFGATVPLYKFHNNTFFRFGSLVEQVEIRFTLLITIYGFSYRKKEVESLSRKLEWS